MAETMYIEFRAGDLFTIEKTSSKDKGVLSEGTEYDYITRTVLNRGISQTTGDNGSDTRLPKGTWSLELMNMTAFYRERDWYAGQFVRCIKPRFEEIDNVWLYFEVLFRKYQPEWKKVLVRAIDTTFEESKLLLPVMAVNGGGAMFDAARTYHSEGYIPDWDYMREFIENLKQQKLTDLARQQQREMRAYKIAVGLE